HPSLLLSCPGLSSVVFFLYFSRCHRDLTSFPTRRSSDLVIIARSPQVLAAFTAANKNWQPIDPHESRPWTDDYTNLFGALVAGRSEEHTSELQSHLNLVCRLLLEKKKKR